MIILFISIITLLRIRLIHSGNFCLVSKYYKHMYICMYVCVCVYVCMCICMCVFMYMYIYIYMYVCMCVCVCIYIYIYIYIYYHILSHRFKQIYLIFVNYIVYTCNCFCALIICIYLIETYNDKHCVYVWSFSEQTSSICLVSHYSK